MSNIRRLVVGAVFGGLLGTLALGDDGQTTVQLPPKREIHPSRKGDYDLQRSAYDPSKPTTFSEIVVGLEGQVGWVYIKNASTETRLFVDYEDVKEELSFWSTYGTTSVYTLPVKIMPQCTKFTVSGFDNSRPIFSVTKRLCRGEITSPQQRK